MPMADRWAPPGYLRIPFVGGHRDGESSTYSEHEVIPSTLTSYGADLTTGERWIETYRMVSNPLDGGHYELVICTDCERCRWQPDVDCGIDEHEHCSRCGHCMGRHGPEISPDYHQPPKDN